DTVLFTNLGSYKNGLYDVVYKSSDYLGLNRVENLNESSEFREGHIVFISEGNNAGAGFFLNPVGDDFVLDSTFAYEDSDISYSQFTVNLNQDINFNGLYNIFSGNLSVSGTYVNFVNVDKVMVPTPDQSNEATNKAYVDAVIATNASAITAEAATARAAEQTNADAITALQSDVDQNESDAEAAIAAEATTARTAEQANASAIAALQSDVDQNESDADTAIADIQNQLNLNPARGLINFAFEVPIYLEPAPPSSGAYYSSSNSIFYNFEIGDKILLTVQSDATENGVYEIISLEFSQGYLDRANLNRASDFDSEEELTLGVFVFVESPSVTGYVLDQRAANFVLDDPLYGAIGFSRFTVDTSEFVNFSQGINADNISGNSISAGGATIWGDMAVNNDFQAGGNTALMNTSIGGTLSVGSDTSLDNLTGNGVINFAGASSVVVPDPTISEEVANKNYVDDFVNTSIASDNAKGLVQLAVTESVSNISEYYLTYESGGSTLNPAQGDLVLLTGQTTASENGIYEVSSVNLSSSYSSSSSSGPTATDYYVSLTRASNFNSANDFLTGSFVFVEKGTHAGKGYVLGELASNFSLGTSPVNYIQFTVDASIVENNSKSIIDNSVDITTATVNISNNTDSITTLQADVDQNEADAEAAIADNAQRLVLLETAAPIWGTNQTAIANLQTDVDQNEADADSTIAALQASDAARPSQVPVLLAHEGSNYPNLNNVYVGYWDYALGQSKVAEAGDRILMVGQPSASDNGIYEVETLNNSYASLVRADDYNSAEEINAGDFVFVQAGDYAGQGYVLGATSESFELGVDALNFSRFTIDTSNPVDFEDRITARELGVNNGYGGTIYFDGSYNYIGGNLAVSGNYVDFDSVNEVVVPTPDHPNEATNKAYVDSVVVPSGGLVAWSSASAIPTGWSDAGLSSPMPNYIWIIKD
ncbi:MAG: hypothetical protein VX033_04820, partial [Verrucomicrobiota bacterium]|nr:hypothetical protein [Verrucomicrobiota bacterium]